MIHPGETFERAGVIVVVLRKRLEPPDAWGEMPVDKMPKGDWYDVLNVASETSIEFHAPGEIRSWHESLFDPCRCRRW